MNSLEGDMNWQEYQVDVPPAVSGDWEVEKHTVTEESENLGRLRAVFSFSSKGRFTPAGNYTGLLHRKRIIMSDTPDEIHDHSELFRFGRGHCLLNGLGLGVAVNGLLMNPAVEHVTAIEISVEVINLVGKHWQDKYGDRLEIIRHNALTYNPPRGERYGFVWHDIWPTICADNLDEMKTLHRKYGRRTDRQASWCRKRCEQS